MKIDNANGEKLKKTHCRFLYKKMEKMRKNIGIQGLLFSFI
jgi:hypothetical protein